VVFETLSPALNPVTGNTNAIRYLLLAIPWERFKHKAKNTINKIQSINYQLLLYINNRKYMNTLIHLKISCDPELMKELTDSLESKGLKTKQAVGLRNELAVSEIIIAISSAGAFTAIYQIIASILKKNEKRKITFKTKKTTISIEGHNISEEESLLKILAPELINKKDKSN
jgi:hypothetical protein